jgi:hypothetical protein
VVLPQLAVSLGVGLVIQQLPDKGNVFLIGAVAAGLSALAWSTVRRVPLAGAEARSAAPLAAGGH